jgi:hypothetical protein
VFHLQLRQFPNVTRAFNLTREQLDEQILAPWSAGRPVEWSERRWSPDRAKLTIYEGPALRPQDMGLGRGWGNATRTGEDVTDRLLAESQRPDARSQALAQLRDEILRRVAAGSLQPREIVGVVGEQHPDWRASDRLALAEQAIWELLHRGSLRLVRTADGRSETVEREQWQPLLLDWATWAGEQRPRLMLEVSE